VGDFLDIVDHVSWVRSLSANEVHTLENWLRSVGESMWLP